MPGQLISRSTLDNKSKTTLYSKRSSVLNLHKDRSLSPKKVSPKKEGDYSLTEIKKLIDRSDQFRSGINKLIHETRKGNTELFD